MKLKQLGHQGDTQWFKLESGIPKSAKKVDKRFIAESERTGSRHALLGNYEMYEVEGVDGFVIDVKDECVLNHCLKSELDAINNNLDDAKILPKKDHRHSVIAPGQYVVGIQNRFDPLENTKKRVID